MHKIPTVAVNAICTVSTRRVWASLAVVMALDARRAVELDDGSNVLCQHIDSTTAGAYYQSGLG